MTRLARRSRAVFSASPQGGFSWVLKEGEEYRV